MIMADRFPILYFSIVLTINYWI